MNKNSLKRAKEYLEKEGHKVCGVKFSDKGYLEINTEEPVIHSTLVHRIIAYHEIYLDNKEKYDNNFSDLEVHHEDTNICNNCVENLSLRPREIHEICHDKTGKRNFNIADSADSNLIIDQQEIYGNVA